LGAHLRKDGIECTSEIAPAAKVRADRTRLEQILLNFLMNAIQAIQMTDASVLQTNGRRIQVRTLTRSLGNDFQIGIQVSDSGQGILKENLSKLFQPFFTTKDVGQGTGLGLPIALGLAHEMHGEIDVESEWGKGATFTVWLPGEKESV
jgi:two-component system NtrC family sensor kinase